MVQLRVALNQMNPVVGDLEGNVARILEALAWAEANDADLALFPELAITGYPPEDLLLKPAFVTANLAALAKVAAAAQRCAAIVGFVDRRAELYNAAAVCAGGEVLGVYRKQILPNYGVFDEERYFTPGPSIQPIYRIGGVAVGVSICEDAWDPAGPVAVEGRGGAELLVSINASPYHAGRVGEREAMLAERARATSRPFVYLNTVGGQDELVFDGASMLLGADGELLGRLPQFEEALTAFDVEVPALDAEPAEPLPAVSVTVRPRSHRGDERPPQVVERLGREAEVYRALVLGTHDYVVKNGFTDVVIALSGGVDSSLVAVIAADALGSEHVHGVSMPSRYSSPGSRSDAEELALRLGIDFQVIPIEAAHEALEGILQPAAGGSLSGLTEENLQSRIRGLLIMALSNQHGWLALTTGNKSELATGYFTIYGDTAGGFAVIKDLLKTDEYEVARWRNTLGAVIPEAVLTKPPSAELRPDQRDDQSLPPYADLDPVLRAYVEEDLTAGELVDRGFDEDLVRTVTRLVDQAEHKRRQTPPGVRVTTKAFGKDRRLPITNRYRAQGAGDEL